MIRFPVLALLLVNFFSSAQNSGYLQGNVMFGETYIDGVHVFNKTTLKGTITTADGSFKVPVKNQDTLLVSSISFKLITLIITTEMVNQDDMVIQMTPAIYELDEVVLNPYGLSRNLTHDLKSINVNSITASSLGLPNANVPLLSYSERKLYALSNHDGILFALINTISGRTKKNNKLKAIIRKQDTIKKVRSSFEDSLFIHGLKIPLNQIDGFIYYCEADSTFQNIMRLDNKLALWDFLIRKSVEYKTMLNNKPD